MSELCPQMRLARPVVNPVVVVSLVRKRDVLSESSDKHLVAAAAAAN